MSVNPVPVWAANTRLPGLLHGLTDNAVRADSVLPGWSRGHVLAHIAGVGKALARQVDYALEDRKIDVYDGGRPARDAGIAANAGNPAADLVEAAVAASGAFDRALAKIGPDDWERSVVYRDGTLVGVVQAYWREIEIHSTDLRLGYTPATWSPEFSDHLLTFTAARAPEGVRVVLRADDGGTWTWGSGEEVEVRGARNDLAAWAAGRTPVGSLTGDLPELKPYP
ncbi:maleylpyruvate isomerase family mycothiol-dependent enzyme [Umezawaea endophytica]|uniref:Maleylpyruvate isomerase family mycothiol-dependent enzyme n=1 Tax=Umezawaea endophytica TaxID=1654476 RepID=A0A9X2VHJ1_9PSEU|nr:maleylpyruvate isomerase family mycothiol-dependent enzyme [Umezawaea endophytica]MCS7476592.1 maleylpyruvate isomerase family mycothiol-dependent enzyme [Umezawaea endophytica]